MEYIYDRETLEALLETLQDEDIVHISGKDFISLISESKRSRGRKPIEVNSDIFDEIVTRWQGGEITARQAMEKLDLKPNTFYRRIKERKLSEMKNVHSEIKDALKSERMELKDLREKVRKGAKETKELAGEKLEQTVSAYRMEKNIFHEKLAAESEQRALEREVRAAVDAERNNYKSK